MHGLKITLVGGPKDGEVREVDEFFGHYLEFIMPGKLPTWQGDDTPIPPIQPEPGRFIRHRYEIEKRAGEYYGIYCE